jgi:hypothetical protein
VVVPLLHLLLGPVVPLLLLLVVVGRLLLLLLLLVVGCCSRLHLLWRNLLVVVRSESRLERLPSWLPA